MVPPPTVSAAPPADRRVPVFAIVCWALGLGAFGQLLIAAMALATRFEEARQVRVVEKEVTKLVAVPVPAVKSPEEASVVARPPAEARPAPVIPAMPEVAPTPLESPSVNDPRSENLIDQARSARIAGDMGMAIVKLEEARHQSPDDPTVVYELGVVHEAMGVFDRAADYYEKVFQMGVSGAGSLYSLAAAKLRDGFEQPGDMLGKLSLGRVRIFNEPPNASGQRVILTIPVQKAPDAEIDVGEIEVSVIFFNRSSKGGISQLEDKSWVSQQWVTLPFDWSGGEENLRMTYRIPAQESDLERLFGRVSYYGQVVSLRYKGEVLDVQAWPRDLAARLPQAPADAPGPNQVPDFLDLPPPDGIPGMVLPPLPE